MHLPPDPTIFTYLPRSFSKDRPRETPGTRPDLQHKRVLQRSGFIDELPAHVRVEEEILRESFGGGDLVEFEDFADGGERREFVGGPTAKEARGEAHGDYGFVPEINKL
jgi:hypothetical protein